MFFERSTGRRRLRTTLAVMGVIASSLALSVPARAFVDNSDSDPTELYVPEAGYVYNAPRTPGRLTPATGALFGSHSDEMSEKKVPAPTPTNPDKMVTVPAENEDQGIWKLEQLIGRTLDIDNHYTTPFNYYEGKTTLDRQEMLDLENNRIPLIGWQCGNSTDITSGKYDKAIHDTATAMKSYPRDFFMRYCWEMDGQRPEKSDLVGTPAEFIAAWRYIWNMFKADGVTNVIWVWTANANGYKVRYDFPAPIGKTEPAPLYYPGDDYVDWVAADGYNWHGADGPNGQDDYRNFLEIYDQFMLWARTADPNHQKGASSKPIMVGEYGTQEQHDDGTLKAAWYRNAHETVMPRPAGLAADQDKWKGAYSDIQAMVYYDVDGKSGPWYVNTTAKSVEGYKEAALNPWFNQIQTLNWGPYTGGSGNPNPGTGPGPTTETTQPGPGTTNPPVVRPQTGKSGYWMLGEDGKVYAFGDAKHLGAPALPAGVNAVDLEMTPSGNGYWIVDNKGNVYGFGDATAMGGIPAGALAPGETVTSLSGTPSGKGYWIFTSKGRAVRFGDATFFGDVSKVTLAAPVLDSIPTPSGLGYYMVAADGGIFSFGDAVFHGSMGATKLNKPVQSLVPDPDGEGYWLVASDGGVFAFKAGFKGSLGNVKLNKPITGMVPYGDGYMMVGEDGGIFNFSNKAFSGSLGATPPARPIVSVSALS